MDNSIIIGKYEIARTERGIWIGLVDEVEGGLFYEDEVEAIIDEFYEENF